MPENIQTGFRITDDTNSEIEAIAVECGATKNATMRMLMALGIKAWEANPHKVSAHWLYRRYERKCDV